MLIDSLRDRNCNFKPWVLVQLLGLPTLTVSFVPLWKCWDVLKPEKPSSVRERSIEINWTVWLVFLQNETKNLLELNYRRPESVIWEWRTTNSSQAPSLNYKLIFLNLKYCIINYIIQCWHWLTYLRCFEIVLWKPKLAHKVIASDEQNLKQ